MIVQDRGGDRGGSSGGSFATGKNKSFCVAHTLQVHLS